MSWVAEVHAKAHILLGQIENSRKLALRTGVDADALCAELFKKIDHLYETEFQLAKAMDDSDLVFHVEGPALQDHTPKLKLIESIFSNIRQQIFSVTKAVANLADARSVTDRDVELSLSALAPGSLYIGIKAEAPESIDGQRNILGDNDPILVATREAMRSIGVISRHLDEDSPDAVREVPDAKVRDAALVAVARLAPSTRSGITGVTIASGADGGGGSGERLTPKLRRELQRQLNQGKTTGLEVVVIRGEVRELDLDFRRFELRRISNQPDLSIRCQLLPGVPVDLERLAGRRVEVVGSGERFGSNLPTMLRVSSLSTIDSGDDVVSNAGLFEPL